MIQQNVEGRVGHENGSISPAGELQECLTRLRKGQLWLIVTLIDVRDQEYWGDQADAFQIGYDEWDRLEAETRSKFGYRECVIGLEGCDDDAPIRCDFCAGRIEQSSCPTSPQQQAVMSSWTRQGHTPTTDKQAALFSMGRSYE